MNDKQKIVTFLLALMCNFTFLATAQTTTSITGKQLPACVEGQKFGPDSLETKRNMAALQEDYKGKNFDNCYAWWHYIFTHAPCSYKPIYQYGPAVIEKIIDKPKYAARKQQMLDTLFMCYEKCIELYPGEYNANANLAYALSKYSKNYNEKAFNLFKESMAGKTDAYDLRHINSYMILCVDLAKNKKQSLEDVVNLYQQLNSISVKEKNNSTDSNLTKAWTAVEGNLAKNLKSTLTCARIDSVYQPKLKANPNDTVLIETVLKLYDIAKCNASPNYMPLVERSFELNPNATAAEMLAVHFRKAKNISKLGFYAEKTAELSNDKAKKKEMYLILAEIYIKSNPSMARSYANKVLDIDPNNGKAYIYIGICIYQGRCGDDFDKAMHACVAIDYFNKAKSVDASVAADANKKIAEYSKFVPKKSDAFLHDKKAGESYTIPCSGISTTVRVK